MKKKKKNSLLTMGAFVIVGVLVVGTIIGVATGSLSSGDDKGKDSIPITEQVERADSSTSGAAVAGETEQPTEKDKDTSAKKQPAENKDDANAAAEAKDSKATKKPKTTKKPKETPKPKENNNKKPDDSLAEKDVTGKDNEISFSDFQ